MSEFFVIPTAGELGADKAPRLAYKNLAPTSNTVTASHDDAGKIYTYDGMTTLKWRPASLSSSIQFDGAFLNTDYIGIAGVNWNSAGASLVVKDSLGNTIASVSGLEDNKPIMFSITKKIYSSLKFEFSCVNTSLEVGEIYFGESTLLPRNVSIGYSPGRWTTNDEISFNTTEANQFGPSTIKARGTTEKFSIKFVPISYMDTTFKAFFDGAKGLPVFFLWNKDNIAHTMFGNWDISNPTYESSLFSSISMTIRGVG